MIRLSGVRAEFNQTMIFVPGMCGTAMIQAGREPDAIGDISMTGGRGSICGTVLG
jgi:hypothetical protein